MCRQSMDYKVLTVEKKIGAERSSLPVVDLHYSHRVLGAVVTVGASLGPWQQAAFGVSPISAS